MFFFGFYIPPVITLVLGVIALGLIITGTVMLNRKRKRQKEEEERRKHVPPPS